MTVVNYIKEMWLLAAEGNLQGIFFYASVYALLTLTYSAFYQLKARSWPNVRGVLLKAGIEKFGATDMVKSDQDFVASALYEYTVDGTVYQGTRVSSWIIVVSYNLRFLLKKQMSYIKKNNDGSVTIFFNSTNPKKSYLIKPRKAGVVITLVLATVPLLLYLSEYHI